MTIKQLIYFIEVVKEGHYTRAAENLYVSQSTLSKSVRMLEKEFDTVLIDRSVQEFRLTAQGEIFLQEAQEIVAHYQAHIQSLNEKLHPSVDGLRLGLPPTSGTIYFSSAIVRFREKYPHIKLYIAEETSPGIPEKVANGELDIGVVIEPFNDNRFKKQIVFQSESVVVVSNSHPLSKTDSISLCDLTREKFLMISPVFMYHEVIQEYCKRAGVSLNVVFESSQWDLILEMVEEGEGISILPKPLVDKYANHLHQIRLENPSFPWSLTIIRKKRRKLTNPMTAFLEFFQ